MDTYEKASALIQLKTALGNPFDLRAMAQKGLAFEVFASVMEEGGFGFKEWAGLVQLNERTLQRYRQENTPLDPIYAERVLYIAQVLEHGKAVFGDQARFRQWLDTENTALGGQKPKALLDSVFGLDILKSELLRIEHGIFA
jgi:putative toxin-antitoxin system antitoxin component (TIGR02293 family)